MSDTFYQVDGSYPYLPDVPDIIGITSPMPYSFYTQSAGNYPSFSVPDILITGAFCYAAKLSSVVIPSTVKSIGKYSFTYTALTSVVLPDNCTYYATSFPEGCAVTGGVLIA